MARTHAGYAPWLLAASLIVAWELAIYGLSQPSSYVLEAMVVSGAQRLPVPHAVITNDGNAASATTDNQGHFQIQIPRVASDEFLVLTIKSGENEYRRRFGGDSLRRRSLSLDLTPHAWETRH